MMRRTFFGLLLLGAGCIAGGASMQRDDRILRELTRQERWAQAAIDAKPASDQLESIRGSDFGSVGAARKELQKLIQAADRGTWIRNTAGELMKEDGDPQLAQQFDRAGRLRYDALLAGDELAQALAEAKGGLTVADLKGAFEAMRKAKASEDRFAKQPISAEGPKLVPSPLPSPRPFVEAAAKLVSLSPELAKELDRLAPDEQTQIHAKLADLEREGEEQKHTASPPAAAAAGSAAVVSAAPGNAAPGSAAPGSAAPGSAAPGSAAPGSAAPGSAAAGGAAPGSAPEPEVEAQAPSNTLKIAGDAAGLIAKKAPLTITLREDGLFALAYEDGDYLVDPDGKLVRKEEVPGAKAAAPEPAPPPAAKPAPRAPAAKKK